MAKSQNFCFQGGWGCTLAKFLSFSNCFTLKQLKMIHNGEFCQKKWLSLAENGQFWSFCRFSHLFPQNEAQIDSEWPVSPDSQLFPSFATKASHFWRNLKNFHSGGGRGVHWHFFWVFQLFWIVSHQVAQNDPQWPILPPKWLRLAQNGQFWLNFNKNLNISAESWPICTEPSKQGSIFLSQSKWVQGVLCYDQNWQKIISVESQPICTKPSEQGSFFWASRNESKKCCAMIKNSTLVMPNLP